MVNSLIPIIGAIMFITFQKIQYVIRISVHYSPSTKTQAYTYTHMRASAPTQAYVLYTFKSLNQQG